MIDKPVAAPKRISLAKLREVHTAPKNTLGENLLYGKHLKSSSGKNWRPSRMADRQEAVAACKRVLLVDFINKRMEWIEQPVLAIRDLLKPKKGEA